MALGACRELAPSKQESTTYEPSLVCRLLILGCRLLIPDRLLEKVEVRLNHARIHVQDCEDCETKEGMLDQIQSKIRLEGDLDATQRARLLEIATPLSSASDALFRDQDSNDGGLGQEDWPTVIASTLQIITFSTGLRN